MEAFYKSWCLMIMDRIEKHPTRSSITLYEDNKKAPNFDNISEKLKNDEYLTPFDWSIDMTNLLYEFADANFEGTPKNLMAKDTLFWLNKKLSGMPKSEKEFTNKRLKKFIEVIDDCIQGTKEYDAAGKNKESENESITKEELENLQLMINAINDEKTLSHVVTIFSHYISDFSANGKVYIDMKKIPKNCYQEIQKLIFANQ